MGSPAPACKPGAERPTPAPGLLEYTAYGLRILSELPFPELGGGDGVEETVRIRCACIRSKPPAQATPDLGGDDREIHLAWESSGSIVVRWGSEILVDARSGVEEALLRTLVLGPALALLLHQRGRLVLHASAVRTNTGAVLFLGGSGWGKSAIAAAMYRRGHPLAADDLAPVHFDGDLPHVYPGFPRLRLWPEFARRLDPSADDDARQHGGVEKRHVPAGLGFSTVPLRLRSIYVLDGHGSTLVRDLRPQEALLDLLRHTYTARLLAGGRSAVHLAQCARLLESVPVRRLRRGSDAEAFDRLAAVVENDLGHVP